LPLHAAQRVGGDALNEAVLLRGAGPAQDWHERANGHAVAPGEGLEPAVQAFAGEDWDSDRQGALRGGLMMRRRFRPGVVGPAPL
jgi:hypothetical protein